jgi:hypothetical protein
VSRLSEQILVTYNQPGFHQTVGSKLTMQKMIGYGNPSLLITSIIETSYVQYETGQS